MSMKHDDRVRAALRLLEALTASPEHTIGRAYACDLLSCTTPELESYCELLSTLADRETGARAIITCTEDAVSLTGTAGALQPLRLSLAEGIVLSHVLGTLSIDRDASERLTSSLLGKQDALGSSQALIASTISYGTCYQRLSEAIEDGVRCRIWYRAHDDAVAAPRLVDPARIDTEEAAAYLIAWNVQKDEERRYRLDRVSNVEFTEDSVTRHVWNERSLAAILSTDGTLVTVECSRTRAMQLTWAGIASVSAAPEDPDRVCLGVHVTSEHWLFDEVLAAASDMKIVSPSSLAHAFVEYARSLLAEHVGSPRS